MHSRTAPRPASTPRGGHRGDVPPHRAGGDIFDIFDSDPPVGAQRNRAPSGPAGVRTSAAAQKSPRTARPLSRAAAPPAVNYRPSRDEELDPPPAPRYDPRRWEGDDDDLRPPPPARYAPRHREARHDDEPRTVPLPASRYDEKATTITRANRQRQHAMRPGATSRSKTMTTITGWRTTCRQIFARRHERWRGV
jgi:hypothetical protein